MTFVPRAACRIEMKIPAKIPRIVRWAYPQLIWQLPAADNTVYLTFDDGPTPDITPRVLDMLSVYGFKATFFLIGKNAVQHSELTGRILNEGHAIGHHSYSHVNGWKTADQHYLSDVRKAAKVIPSPLFRPPYGRITRSQITALEQDYKIIMWNVLSGDYDRSLIPETCAANVLNNLKPGCIVVFHDSVKAWPNLQIALPQVLENMAQNGFTSQAISL
jgi:peptidoglycan/xylan/chitin deacetylase (PgdA/CDA1 family)